MGMEKYKHGTSQYYPPHYIEVSGRFQANGHFAPGEETQIFFGYEVGWPNERFWTLWKREKSITSNPTPGSSDVHPVAC